MRLKDFSIIQEGAGIRTFQYRDKGIQLLTVTNILEGSVDLNKSQKYVEEAEFLSKYKHLQLEIGDIVSACSGGSWGKTAIFKEKNCVMLNTSTLRLRFFNDIGNNLYLYHMTKSFWFKSQLSKQLSGMQPNFGYAHYSKLLIPIPPLEEQQRIVEKIESMEPYLKEYDKIEKQLTKLESEIKDKLKKSILQYAIQGKLVKQDPNDEPASVLLERIKAEKEQLIKEGKIKRDKNESFIYKGDDKNYYENINGKVVNITEDIPFDIPNNWCWIRIKNLLSSIQYGYNAPAKQSGCVKMLRITDIQNNMVNWKSVPYCDITNDMLNIYQIFEKDIFIARTGGTIGKSYLLNQDMQNCVFAGYLIRFQLINKHFASYINYFLKSPCYWSQVTKGSMGTGQPNINGVTLGNLLIPIVSQTILDKIIIKLEKLFQIIDLS